MMKRVPGVYSSILLLQLELPEAFSLKDRRQVIRSVLEKTRNRFNVSVTDLGPDGAFHEVYVAFAAVSSSHSSTEERMDSVLRFIRAMEENGDFFIVRDLRKVDSNADFQD